jgi:hypothetical protein
MTCILSLFIFVRRVFEKLGCLSRKLTQLKEKTFRLSHALKQSSGIKNMMRSLVLIA